MLNFIGAPHGSVERRTPALPSNAAQQQVQSRVGRLVAANGKRLGKDRRSALLDLLKVTDIYADPILIVRRYEPDKFTLFRHGVLPLR